MITEFLNMKLKLFSCDGFENCISDGDFRVFMVEFRQNDNGGTYVNRT